MVDAFSGEEVERYSRQMLLPQIGVEGQKRIRDGRVLIVGCGGLGCPAALYLAGAGVGVIGLVDRPGDVVERSNLHRQIAHSNERVGVDKVDSAVSAIKALNPAIQVETHTEFTPSNAVTLTGRYGIVLDCTDNVASRYLINDACSLSRTPLVSGSAIGFEGQLTVYGLYPETPCYRCIFPSPPPPQCVGSCASAGVLGPVPGTIGTLQALEALKILGKIPDSETLAGRMLLFDGLGMAFKTVTLRQRMPTCKVCSSEPSIDVENFDYHHFATGGSKSASATSPLPSDWRMSVETFCNLRRPSKNSKDSREYFLLDVRPAEQFAMCRLPEATNIPLDLLKSDPVQTALVHERARSHSQVIVLCRRGNQSQSAVRHLREHGVSTALDVQGGLAAWHHQVDQSFPLY